MMTTKRLIKICNRLGYTISERKITDWIQKGLIPPRKQRGQGRGGGKLYYWDEPYIIAQTLAAEEFMNWHSQSEHVMLWLWFNGFPIDAGRVRELWTRLLRQKLEGISSLFPDPFDLEEKIDRKLLRGAKGITKGSEDTATMNILELIFKTTMINGFDLELAHVNLEELAKLVIDENADNNEIPMISNVLVNGFHFLQKYFSPESRIQIMESVSAKEFKKAQEDWGILLRFLEPMLRASLPEDVYAWPNVRWARFWWRIITHFGGNAILVVLALRREGFLSKIEKTVFLLQNDSNRLALIREIRNLRSMGKPTQQGTLLFNGYMLSLEDIWRN